MLIDLTIKITPEMAADARGNLEKSLVGHVGTHFDVMDREFPLDFTERNAIVFDVRNVVGRDIGTEDVDLSLVQRDMFVAFYTGYMEKEPYGSKTYFTDHPQLSHALIDALLHQNISIIGIDCAGIRRGKEHTPTDQHCADNGVFVVENLCNLHAAAGQGGTFTACTYPLHYEGVTGLPCRVVAKVSG